MIDFGLVEVDDVYVLHVVDEDVPGAEVVVPHPGPVQRERGLEDRVSGPSVSTGGRAHRTAQAGRLT